MTAFKCLRAGAIGPFTEFEWPQPTGSDPGTWVDAGAVDLCRRGIHACQAEDLPYWLQDELWEIELEGDFQRIGRKLAARRGRLVRRMSAWDPDAARAFALTCADRVTRLATSAPEVSGHADDAVRNAAIGKAAVTGFIAARAAELIGGVDAHDAERALQVEWLAKRLDANGFSV